MLTIQNLKNWKVEARGPEVQEHLKSCSEFEASSGYRRLRTTAAATRLLLWP